MRSRSPIVPGDAARRRRAEDTAEARDVVADDAVGSSATTGVLWLTAQRWAVRISGFVTIAVLTRFLTPAEFGTVAAATTVLPFFYLLADLGFTAYLVQASRVDSRLLSTGFWFSALAGVALSLILILAAPLFGLVFRSDEIVPVLQVLSFSVILTAAGSVPTVLMKRSMRFRTLALQGSFAAFVAQIVAVAMVIAGAGVWALVGQALVSQLLISVLPWFTARWRPRLSFSWVEFRTIAVYGSKVIGVEFVAVTRAWAEAAIISAGLGMTGLGYINIAQRLIQVVQDLTGSAIVPVSTVAFAKVRESAPRLNAAYLRASRLTYALLAPPLIFVAVAASVVIPVIFGEGWEQSAPVAQILALAGILVVAATLDHGLFYGLGKPGRWFAYAVVIDILTVAVTVVMVPLGIVAVAWGFLGVAGVATMIRWILVARLLDLRISTIARPFGVMILLIGVAGGAGYGVLSLCGGLPDIVAAAAVGVAVVVVCVGVMLLVARPVMLDAWAQLRRLRSSRRPGR